MDCPGGLEHDRRVADDLRAFCARAASLAGEHPEAYVGSPEHLRDVEGLAAVAPPEIRTQLETFRNFLASDFVDPVDPDFNLPERWPPHVQAAIKDLTDYIAAHC